MVTSSKSTTNNKSNISTMPPRSLSNLSVRSPVCITRWDDGSSCSSSVEFTSTKNKPDRTVPLSKSVSFADHNEVFEITHLDDIPADQVAEIWYDPNEYAEIKKSYQLTIFLMENGEKPVEDGEQTTRGLEYRTQEGAWARYENKRDAYNAVLDEQDRQWKEDVDDWEAISKVYLDHSTKCLKAACERGMKDREDILEYISEKAKASSEKKLKKKKVVKSDKEKVTKADKEKTVKVDKEKLIKSDKEKVVKPDKVKSDKEKVSKSEKVVKGDKEKIDSTMKKKKKLEKPSSQEGSPEPGSRPSSDDEKTAPAKKTSVKKLKEKRESV